MPRQPDLSALARDGTLSKLAPCLSGTQFTLFSAMVTADTSPGNEICGPLPRILPKPAFLILSAIVSPSSSKHFTVSTVWR